MPWQDLLSPAQRFQVTALPASLREYEEFYTLTSADLEFVAAHRTHTNRLGVAAPTLLPPVSGPGMRAG